MADIDDDVIKWKRFHCYWPFVRRIRLSPVNSPHRGQWRGALMFSLICALNKRLSKLWWGWWFETPSRPLWLHYNVYRQSSYTSSNACMTTQFARKLTFILRQCWQITILELPLHRPGTWHHCVYAHSQWKTTSHCNVVSHWLRAYTNDLWGASELRNIK